MKSKTVKPAATVDSTQPQKRDARFDKFLAEAIAKIKSGCAGHDETFELSGEVAERLEKAVAPIMQEHGLTEAQANGAFITALVRADLVEAAMEMRGAK